MDQRSDLLVCFNSFWKRRVDSQDHRLNDDKTRWVLKQQI